MIDNKKLLGNDNDIFQIKEVLEKSLDNKWTQEFVYLLRKFFYIEYWSNVEKNERYTIQMIQEILKKHLDFLDEDRRTEEVLRKFRAMLPYLQQLVISDMKAAYEGDPAAKSYEEIIAAYPGPLAVLIQRTANCLYQLKVPILPRIMTEYAHSITGIDGDEITTDFWRKINMNQRLLKNGENINSQDITLFCFPFAGGGASTYTSWIKKLKDKITVCPIQLPGREERIMEKPYTDMSELLRDLTDEIVIAIKGKYALWGHSMGGKIAYELEKYLENKGYQAQCIFASGCRIPNIPEPNPIYHLKDEAFKRELERFGGTPKKVLENKELLDFFLPMLRADFTLADTYCDNSMTVLHSPIVAFGGRQDNEAEEEAIKQWSHYTDNTFQYEIFEGDHFYLKEHEDMVIEQLKKHLKRIEHESKNLP